MADNNVQSAPEQYNVVYTLRVEPGIKRDGTIFESREFSDGEWCRFQRGTPKKMGGYRQLFGSFNGVPRGMVTNAFNGINYIYVGNAGGIDVFTTGTTFGVGSGPYPAVINQGYAQQVPTGGSTTTFQLTSTSTPIFDYSSVYPAGTKVIFDQSANPTIYTTVGTPTFASPVTTVTFTPAYTGTPTNVWIANDTFDYDDRHLWQFDLQYSPSGEELKVLAHPGLNLANIDNGVPTQVLYGNVTEDAPGIWNFYGLADTTGQNPTYLPISVSGGVCVLYPYIFVYGDNGYIANNHVEAVYGSQTLTDWNGATANQVNMSSSKIVKGVPVRGGTNSPSGLFWATDSLIRVSFTGAAPLYWRYDIISSQISIMSSSAVVEMDGVYYWLGVDRFYQYNGVVSVLANDKNINWLLDNMNFEQRQKVWATKVPRYNEIWFFYPRGSATEVTDAIVYNVKDKLWYDAGEAAGAKRSCGWTTEIFPTPIWAGWEYNVSYSQPFTTIEHPGSEPAPTSSQVYIDGDVTNTFAPGNYLTLSQSPTATVYKVLDSIHIFNILVPSPGVTRITLTEPLVPYPAIGSTVYGISGGYPLWQQEFGLNEVSYIAETAVTSSFTTCDISWVGGTPAQDAMEGANRRMHMRRIEPDFVQSGEMNLTLLGRKFARGTTEDSGPYAFGAETGKIDLRVEHREMRLKFESNTISGNYEMGRLLITAEYGDERP
ncbi:hypothetical protein UFOVP1286_4 [uncultured Caudovirales phage]|uniref:Uncharacterized protein n=3 Tax=uncultured Caudovirales phage TaxID=2100421 RepID=A0A6J5S919_9CAUD|nr:hypothetical protein UFOVP1286_4 [uncultured Caudovirales phage]CAB4205541.1 hypothetical protein UFOVP1407_34 [uncultured Caudovirales phage]